MYLQLVSKVILYNTYTRSCLVGIGRRGTGQEGEEEIIMKICLQFRYP